MKKLIKLGIISSVIALSMIIPKASWAKSIEEDIKKTGILTVGVRDDSPLFGYGPSKIGYCSDFAQELAKKLSEKLGKPISVKLVQSTTQNRWELVKDSEVAFECGPNTINPDSEEKYGIKFSEAFFLTATQIFVRADVTEENLKNGKIGLISETTTERDLKQLYPEQQIDNSYIRRSHGIADAQLGEITGFASDGILLIGTALGLQINPQSYAFVTPVKDGRPFCAAYGMILPEGDDNTEWRKTINDLIKDSGQQIRVWDTWFADLLPYMESVMKACQ